MKFFRNCPKCLNSISYNRKGDRDFAQRAGSCCKKCMISNGKFKKGQQSTNKKSIYNCWLEKFGKQEADRRWKIFLNKQSFNNKGKKNNMYGKPTPIGSGNGWSGWYKGWYFRSLLELSYMIKIIERFNLKWESAEQKKFTVTYSFLGSSRTYRADFFINDKYLIDCKPKKLMKTMENTLKKEAMEKFCIKNHFIFKFSEVPKLTLFEIVDLYNSKQIKFLDRYDEKFKQKYEDLIR